MDDLAKLIPQKDGVSGVFWLFSYHPFRVSILVCKAVKGISEIGEGVAPRRIFPNTDRRWSYPEAPQDAGKLGFREGLALAVFGPRAMFELAAWLAGSPGLKSMLSDIPSADLPLTPRWRRL